MEKENQLTQSTVTTQVQSVSQEWATTWEITHQQNIQESISKSEDVVKQKKHWARKKRLCFTIWIPCGIAIAFWSTKLWQYYSLISERIQSSKSSISQNQESWIYTINWQTTITVGSKSIANYHFSKLDDDNEWYYDYSDEKSITLSTAEYKRLDDLYSLRHYILFDFTFSDWKLKTRRILNKETKKDLWEVDQIDWKSVVGEDNILYLSNYAIWEEFELDDDEGIYNDTNESHTIIIIDSRWKENEHKLWKWKIYVNDDFRDVTIKVK